MQREMGLRERQFGLQEQQFERQQEPIDWTSLLGGVYGGQAAPLPSAVQQRIGAGGGPVGMGGQEVTARTPSGTMGGNIPPELVNFLSGAGLTRGDLGDIMPLLMQRYFPAPKTGQEQVIEDLQRQLLETQTDIEKLRLAGGREEVKTKKEEEADKTFQTAWNRLRGKQKITQPGQYDAVLKTDADISDAATLVQQLFLRGTIDQDQADHLLDNIRIYVSAREVMKALTNVARESGQLQSGMSPGLQKIYLQKMYEQGGAEEYPYYHQYIKGR